MIKLNTLHGAALSQVPAIIKPTLAEFKHLSTVEIWKSASSNHQSFEYRLFHAQQTAPCIRIRISGVN
jgi:hypothetical protein